MDRTRVGRRRLGWGLRLIPGLMVLVATGCQTVRTPEAQIAKSNIPREFQKVAMPEYVIEPPDILLVEVLQALPGRPIQGEFLVRPDGTIQLSFYGSVYVEGLTLSQAKEKIIFALRKFVLDDALGLVDEKGNRKEAKDSDRVIVDVGAYNSKVYYVLGDVGSPGRLPITGNETVLDAIQYAGGLLPTSAPQNIRLVRPAPPGACCEQVLPVNYHAITSTGDSTTNYQLLPGDRLVVYRDPIVRTTLFIDRIAAPFSTVINQIFTYSFAARGVETLTVPIRQQFNTTTTAPVRPPTAPGAQ